jgi:hypothetical protein
MSWSKATITIALTGAADALGTPLTSIGTVKDKSTNFTTSDGDALIAKATGGVVVAREQLEGEIVLTTRIIEPGYAVEAAFTGATNNTTSLVVKSNVVPAYWSAQVDPKNIGGVGIKIRKANVSYKPGYSEEEGHYADVTFTVVQCADLELYTKYTKTA